MIDGGLPEGPDMVQGSRPHRWTLPDLASSVRWCQSRNTEGIRCIIADLNEYATDQEAVSRGVLGSIETIRAIETSRLDASVAIKLSAVGALLDHRQCLENTLAIAAEAKQRHVAMEIDMEGRGLVDLTIRTASACASGGLPPTLALQAYLDRTKKDLDEMVVHKIGVRLVKGTYHGDTDDFTDIRERFRALVVQGLTLDASISAATHDLSILDWIRDEQACEKSRLGLGFLMGLADMTKTEFARNGWTVSEYVPYGQDSGAYVARREHYLRHLESLGMTPAP
ncbi:MAG TPA: proline dehydrogenase family protein [Methanoregulaceae archaeon]|nr:proline dehydrogenase family protein [Methanoregulaceae archaeon]